MFYTIYKITNKLDGKIYIGKHQTKDLNDGYMGSGKHLKRAIDKYGLENFTKEILFQFDNEIDMNAKEAELVTEEFVKEDTNYNLCPGGNGGWGYINLNEELRIEKNKKARKNANSKGAHIKGAQAVKWLIENDQEWLNAKTEKQKESLKEHYKTSRGSFYNKIHSEATKEKIGNANSEHQSGEGNSQYGTMWVTNGKESKKIKKVDAIPDGWHKGRKMQNINYK